MQSNASQWEKKKVKATTQYFLGSVTEYRQF